GMLNDGNVTLDNILINIRIFRVQFDRVVLSGTVDVINGRIKQVSLRRNDFANAPVIVTNIVVGYKITVLVGSVGVDQFFTLVHAVYGTGKSGITLSLAIRATQVFYHLVGIS